eukprot:gene11877-14983_t
MHEWTWSSSAWWVRVEVLGEALRAASVARENDTGSETKRDPTAGHGLRVEEIEQVGQRRFPGAWCPPWTAQTNVHDHLTKEHRMEQTRLAEHGKRNIGSASDQANQQGSGFDQPHIPTAQDFYKGRVKSQSLPEAGAAGTEAEQSGEAEACTAVPIVPAPKLDTLPAKQRAQANSTPPYPQGKFSGKGGSGSRGPSLFGMGAMELLRDALMVGGPSILSQVGHTSASVSESITETATHLQPQLLGIAPKHQTAYKPEESAPSAAPPARTTETATHHQPQLLGIAPTHQTAYKPEESAPSAAPPARTTETATHHQPQLLDIAPTAYRPEESFPCAHTAPDSTVPEHQLLGKAMAQLPYTAPEHQTQSFNTATRHQAQPPHPAPKQQTAHRPEERAPSAAPSARATSDSTELEHQLLGKAMAYRQAHGLQEAGLAEAMRDTDAGAASDSALPGSKRCMMASSLLTGRDSPQTSLMQDVQYTLSASASLLSSYRTTEDSLAVADRLLGKTAQAMQPEAPPRSSSTSPSMESDYNTQPSSQRSPFDDSNVTYESLQSKTLAYLTESTSPPPCRGRPMLDASGSGRHSLDAAVHTTLIKASKGVVEAYGGGSDRAHVVHQVAVQAVPDQGASLQHLLDSSFDIDDLAELMIQLQAQAGVDGNAVVANRAKASTVSNSTAATSHGTALQHGAQTSTARHSGAATSCSAAFQHGHAMSTSKQTQAGADGNAVLAHGAKASAVNHGAAATGHSAALQPGHVVFCARCVLVTRCILCQVRFDHQLYFDQVRFEKQHEEEASNETAHFQPVSASALELDDQQVHGVLQLLCQAGVSVPDHVIAMLSKPGGRGGGLDERATLNLFNPLWEKDGLTSEVSQRPASAPRGFRTSTRQSPLELNASGGEVLFPESVCGSDDDGGQFTSVGVRFEASARSRQRAASAPRTRSRGGASWHKSSSPSRSSNGGGTTIQMKGEGGLLQKAAGLPTSSASSPRSQSGGGASWNGPSTPSRFATGCGTQSQGEGGLGQKLAGPPTHSVSAPRLRTHQHEGRMGEREQATEDPSGRVSRHLSPRSSQAGVSSSPWPCPGGTGGGRGGREASPLLGHSAHSVDRRGGRPTTEGGRKGREASPLLGHSAHSVDMRGGRPTTEGGREGREASPLLGHSAHSVDRRGGGPTMVSPGRRTDPALHHGAQGSTGGFMQAWREATQTVATSPPPKPKPQFLKSFKVTAFAPSSPGRQHSTGPAASHHLDPARAHKDHETARNGPPGTPKRSSISKEPSRPKGRSILDRDTASAAKTANRFASPPHMAGPPRTASRTVGGSCPTSPAWGQGRERPGSGGRSSRRSSRDVHVSGHSHTTYSPGSPRTPNRLCKLGSPRGGGEAAASAGRWGGSNTHTPYILGSPRSGASPGCTQGNPGTTGRQDSMYTDARPGRRQGSPGTTSRQGSLYTEASPTRRQGSPGTTGRGGNEYFDTSPRRRQGSPGPTGRHDSTNAETDTSPRRRQGSPGPTGRRGNEFSVMSPRQRQGSPGPTCRYDSVYAETDTSPRRRQGSPHAPGRRGGDNSETSPRRRQGSPHAPGRLGDDYSETSPRRRQGSPHAPGRLGYDNSETSPRRRQGSPHAPGRLGDDYSETSPRRRQGSPHAPGRLGDNYSETSPRRRQGSPGAASRQDSLYTGGSPGRRQGSPGATSRQDSQYLYTQASPTRQAVSPDAAATPKICQAMNAEALPLPVIDFGQQTQTRKWLGSLGLNVSRQEENAPFVDNPMRNGVLLCELASVMSGRPIQAHVHVSPSTLEAAQHNILHALDHQGLLADVRQDTEEGCEVTEGGYPTASEPPSYRRKFVERQIRSELGLIVGVEKLLQDAKEGREVMEGGYSTALEPPSYKRKFIERQIRSELGLIVGVEKLLQGDQGAVWTLINHIRATCATAAKSPYRWGSAQEPNQPGSSVNPHHQQHQKQHKQQQQQAHQVHGQDAADPRVSNAKSLLNMRQAEQQQQEQQLGDARAYQQLQKAGSNLDHPSGYGRAARSNMDQVCEDQVSGYQQLHNSLQWEGRESCLDSQTIHAGHWQTRATLSTERQVGRTAGSTINHPSGNSRTAGASMDQAGQTTSSANIQSAQLAVEGGFDQFVRELNDGSFICWLASFVSGKPVLGVHYKPRKEGPRRANWMKAITLLRSIRSMARRFMNDEEALIRCDRGALIGLLEDLHRLHHGQPSAGSVIRIKGQQRPYLPYCVETVDAEEQQVEGRGHYNGEYPQQARAHRGQGRREQGYGGQEYIGQGHIGQGSRDQGDGGQEYGGHDYRGQGERDEGQDYRGQIHGGQGQGGRDFVGQDRGGQGDSSSEPTPSKQPNHVSTPAGAYRGGCTGTEPLSAQPLPNPLQTLAGLQPEHISTLLAALPYLQSLREERLAAGGGQDVPQFDDDSENVSCLVEGGAPKGLLAVTQFSTSPTP